MKKLALVAAALSIAATAYAGDKAAPTGDKAAAPAASPAAAAEMKMHDGVVNPSKAKWMSIGDPKNGPWVTPVQGDSTKEAFTAYLKMKGGGDSGWHTHDADYSAVVVEGTATHQDQGGKEHKLTAGQAWTSKGGVNHRNTCVGKKDCVLFLSVRGPFNFVPKTADGKDLPAQPAKTDSKGTH